MQIAPEKEKLVKELIVQFGGKATSKKRDAAKASLIKDIKEAVEELKLVREVKKKQETPKIF